jgi:hypothetical protein
MGLLICRRVTSYKMLVVRTALHPSTRHAPPFRSNGLNKIIYLFTNWGLVLPVASCRTAVTLSGVEWKLIRTQLCLLQQMYFDLAFGISCYVDRIGHCIVAVVGTEKNYVA